MGEVFGLRSSRAQSWSNDNDLVSSAPSAHFATIATYYQKHQTMESPKASTSASPASATPNPLLQRNLKKLKKPSNKKSKPASSKKGNASSSALAVQVGTEEEEREFQARLLEEMEALAKEAEGEEAKGETEARLLEGALGDGETLGGNGGDLLAIGEAGRKDAGGGDARSSAHQPALKSKESKHHHHGLGDKLLELGEDLADKLHVHAGAYGHGPEGPAEGEKKVSRQQARKVSLSHPPSLQHGQDLNSLGSISNS